MDWPDIKLPPINLWNVPKQSIEKQPTMEKLAERGLAAAVLKTEGPEKGV